MAMEEFPDEHTYVGQALPTPTNTPYRTPSRSRSRRSSQYDVSSPPSSSPPPLPPDNFWGKDGANETMSALDPRRFTPTLHANLVSEILSLRRELDSKVGFIDGLETSLQTAKAEYDTLNTTFSSTAKETRSLRRQLQLLEGGTSNALGELARERDEAVDSVAETKRRLEIAQKKARTQEEDATRTQAAWESDKQGWDNERRTLERKVHVVEGRLKAIIEEVANQQAAAHARGHQRNASIDSEVEEALRENGAGHGSDTASIRSMSLKGVRPISAMSNDDSRNVRISTLSGLNGFTGSKLNGLSLADELEMDGDEQEQDEETGDAPSTEVTAAPNHDDLGKVQRSERLHDLNPETLSKEIQQPPTVHKVEYIDTGVQFSPPPSPRLPVGSPDPIHVDKPEERTASPTSNEANQRRKRMSANVGAAHGQMQLPLIVVPSPTVSSACQTMDGPPSPPRTPKSPDRDTIQPPAMQLPGPEMTSSSTQTDAVREITPASTPPAAPFAVPSIAIHPPTSAPVSPGKAVLPPQTKSVGCQVSFKAHSRSISVQTSEIRIDKRSITLPANLLPSAISSSPAIPEPKRQGPTPKQAQKPAPKKSSKKSLNEKIVADPTSSPPTLPQEVYPISNDDGPLRSGKTNKIKRPFRTSSLFAGFEVPSSDDGDDFHERESLENDYRTALTAPKPLVKSGKEPDDKFLGKANDMESREGSSGWANIFKSSNEAIGPVPDGDSPVPNLQSSFNTRKWTDKQRRLRNGDGSFTSNPIKQPNIRKSALISSGTAIHTQRARSPSLEDIREIKVGKGNPNPPFPVPTRSSSRKIPISASEGARSPTRQSSGSYRRRSRGPASSNTENLRKVRSAAAISRAGRRDRPRSRSPPGQSVSSLAPSMAPDSPKLPPLPRNEVTTPHYSQDRLRREHRTQPSSNPSTNEGASVRSSVHQTSVVDAISQTMVGEWMWKYVRRRKSFGVPDSPGGAESTKPGDDGTVNVTGNGIRHRRWVWLAPYERAVMWSSRQPTSGSALLGKSGRKLTIQSVLDVKDDTPSPKNTTPQELFNRSILILTPARALKFTASSKERHYVWLTALTFLSHSADNSNDLPLLPPQASQLPPVPQREYEPPSSKDGTTLRRHPIRDSIRVAKGKSRSGMTGPTIRPSHSGGAHQDGIQEIIGGLGSVDNIAPAADPPIVPRFSSHGRRRSNTGPRAPPTSFRSFTHQPVPSSTHSFVTNGSSEAHGHGSSVGGLGFHSGQSSLSQSQRTSEASAPAAHNFFDAVGTVRMEAFVRRSAGMHYEEQPASDPRRAAQHRKAKIPWGAGSDLYGNIGGQPDQFLPADDPFRGF